ncbi:MAG: hypothetical protein H0W83_01345 [Planctomycetes bacterium]|nr:hypothetical protein [Planctomycetota bacterium]
MNKAKPFLFWIISGVVILVELVLLLCISPSGKSGQSPQEVKTELDKQSDRLDGLHDKAMGPKGQATITAQVFNAEDPADIKKLTTQWLPTKQWKKPLEEHVALYNQQLPAIKEYLSKRSVFLHQPIASASDRSDWYAEYERRTAQLLQGLNDQNGLVLPTAAVTSKDGTEAPPATDFATATAIRHNAGFYTKGNSFPDPSEYPEMTMKYHIVEMIAAALLDSKATNKETPIAPLKVQQEERAALSSVEWKNLTDKSVTLGVTLNGPLSALLAAEAALEQVHDSTKPIIVITGGTLSRKNFVAGDRAASAEPMIAKLSLAVLDFEGGAAPEAAKIAEPILPAGSRTPAPVAPAPVAPAVPGPGAKSGAAPVAPIPGVPAEAVAPAADPRAIAPAAPPSRTGGSKQ